MENKDAYWSETKGLTIKIVIAWAFFGYVPTILFVEQLNGIHLGGLPLGFWFAQNGSIYAFILLIVWYIKGMAAIDEKYGVAE